LPLEKSDMMQFGIIGLPQAGKTTVFNALTGRDQPTVRSSGRLDVHLAVVDVPDQRVDRLSELFKPRKTTYARVAYADITGLEGAAEKGEISGALLSQLSQMDGFVHVVRCFENPMVSHPNGAIEPLRDLDSLNSEMLLNDLIVVERRLERIQNELARGRGRNDATLVTESKLMQQLQTALSNDLPLRDLTLDSQECKIVAGFGFLSLKPMLILFNTSDGQPTPCVDYTGRHCEVVALQGKLEMDIAQLPVEDRSLFMQEYGIEETGLIRVINQSYCLMDIQSFFTVGEDEVHAWAVPVGASALEAAGAIHTDLQKGFIRAEVIPNEELIALGTLNEARKKGKLRLEGKDYIVQDGDIVHVRFNI
jgi:GTP-binding protein YchF